MDWNTEITKVIIVSIIYMAIFLIAELWRHFGTPEVEKTRKFVHIAGGIVALSFGFLFKSHWSVLFLCSAFAFILFLTKHLGMLKSVHCVNRISGGSFYYPIAIYLTYFFSVRLNFPQFYFISILVLTLSDSLAALIGSSYGFKLYKVEEEAKSIEGSIIFFLSTFIIVHLGLLLLTNVPRFECVLAALYIAILVTAFEAISLGGADNIIVPVGTLYILSKITTKPPEEIIHQICLMFAVFLLITLIAAPKKKIGKSGILGIALLGYGSCSLMGFEWFFPILIGTILITYTDLFIPNPIDGNELYRIRSVFYILIIPFVWLIVANLIKRVDYLLLIPYLLTFIAHLSIIWHGRSREIKLNNENIRHSSLYHCNFIIRALLLCLIFLPVHILLNTQMPQIVLIFSCFIGIIIADRLFWFLEDKFATGWSFLNLLRLRMAVVLMISLLLFATNYYLLAM